MYIRGCLRLVCTMPPLGPSPTLKLCRTCVHLKPMPHMDIRFARCNLFGDVDPVSGETHYKYADSMRAENYEIDGDTCGVDGKYHEPKPKSGGHGWWTWLMTID